MQDAPTVRPRSICLLATLAALLLSGSFGTVTLAPVAYAATPRHAARALTVTDTGHLRYVKESGSQIIDEGVATGTLPGTVRVGFNVGATVAAAFTIYTHNGSIVGHGYGALHDNKSKSDIYVSFGGSMTVSHGTGRYDHAHGQGGFYGVIDRNNYAITIQTTGTLSY